MNRRKFLKSGLIWVPAFPAIVRAQSEDWFRIASEGKAASGGGSYHLQESFGAAGGDDNGAFNGHYIAYSWTAGSSYTLKRIDLGLIKSGTDAGTIKAQIWTGAGTAPTAQTGSDSASVNGTLVTSTSNTAPTYVEFDFSTGITITSGTQYWAACIPSSDTYGFCDVPSGGGLIATSANDTSWTAAGSGLVGTFKTYTFS